MRGTKNSRAERMRRFRYIEQQVSADLDQAAELCEVKPDAVRQWISGINAPSYEHLEKLEAKYGAE